MIRGVQAVGPAARLDLEQIDGSAVEVEIPRYRLRALGVGEGDGVLVVPRAVRVFPAEQAA